MKCFYHTDMDGKCSAAIVNKWANQSELHDLLILDERETRDYIPINYSHVFPL